MTGLPFFYSFEWLPYMWLLGMIVICAHMLVWWRTDDFMLWESELKGKTRWTLRTSSSS